MKIADLLELGYVKQIVSGSHMLLKPLNNGDYVSIILAEATEFPADGDDVIVCLRKGAEQGIGDLLSEYDTNLDVIEDDLAVHLDDGTVVFDPYDQAGELLVSPYDLQDTAYYYYAEED